MWSAHLVAPDDGLKRSFPNPGHSEALNRADVVKSTGALVDIDRRAGRARQLTLLRIWRMDRGESPTGTTQSTVSDGLLPCRGRTLPPVAGLRMFDFSGLGLGMDLRHPSSTDLVGSSSLRWLPVGASIEVTLRGEVRNAKAGPDGIVRVGIEFTALSETERSIVDLLDIGPGQGPDLHSLNLALEVGGRSSVSMTPMSSVLTSRLSHRRGVLRHGHTHRRGCRHLLERASRTFSVPNQSSTSGPGRKVGKGWRCHKSSATTIMPCRTPPLGSDRVTRLMLEGPRGGSRPGTGE